MGGFASALQGLGGVGADIAQGRQQFQDQRTADAFNKLKMKQDALNIATIQSKLRQAGQPEFLGTAVDPTTKATLAILRDPATGQIRTQALMPGQDKSGEQAQVDQMLQSVKDPQVQSMMKNAYGLFGMAGLQKVYDQYSGEMLKPPPKPPGSENFGTQAGQYTTADNKKGWGYRNDKDGKIYDAASGQPVAATNFVPTSGMPTPGISFQPLVGPGGTTQVNAIPTMRSKTGGFSIGTPVPVGQKALPPGVAEKIQSMVSTTQPVLDALTRMRDNVDVLSNPASVAKIFAATKQGMGSGALGIISRFPSMTRQEQQYATDYITATEGINVVRQALQATGFRGPDAFQAMESQKGSLLGRPDISRGVLDTTIKMVTANIQQARAMLGDTGNTGGTPGALNIGDNVGGFRYMGGDPNNQSSWKAATK